MKQVFYIIVASLVIGLPIEHATGITTYGGNGLVRVQSANNVYRGALWGTINMDYTQSSGSYTFRDGTGAINVLYGVRHYFEIGLSQTLYQDRAFGALGPAIGPLRVSLKGALPTSAPSSLNLGAQILFSIPIGKASNVEWESYTAPSTSVGGMIILSYDSNPIDLNRSRRLHINAGFIYHNDKNAYVDAEDPNSSLNTINTSQAIFGAGLQVPLRENIHFLTELTGEYFIDINPYTLIAREGSKISPYIRLTPGLRYQLGQFYIMYGLELRAFSSGQFTEYDNQSVYPRWRAIINLKYRIFEGVPPTYRRGRSMRISGRSSYQYDRDDDMDREEGIEEIRQDRIKAQRELEEMKESMEEDPGASR